MQGSPPAHRTPLGPWPLDPIGYLDRRRDRAYNQGVIVTPGTCNVCYCSAYLPVYFYIVIVAMYFLYVFLFCYHSIFLIGIHFAFLMWIRLQTDLRIKCIHLTSVFSFTTQRKAHVTPIQIAGIRAIIGGLLLISFSGIVQRCTSTLIHN